MSRMRTAVRRRLAAGTLFCAALVLGLAAATPAAHASFTLTLTEVGSDVVATGFGSLDLSGLLGPADAPAAETGIIPLFAAIITGPVAATAADVYQIPISSGPPDFGSGGVEIKADSGSGHRVGIIADFNALVVPDGYASGDPLSTTSTWIGETFATLGVTPGVYTFTFPEDTFTVIIGAAAVPMPATFVLLASAIIGLGAGRAWRRR